VYFFLKTVAIFVVIDAAERSCEEQQRMKDKVLRISRTMFSLLTPVLSPGGFFCSETPALHDCSLCNLLGAAIPPACSSQLQQVGTLCEFCFSGHSRWLWPPLQHRQPDVAKTLTIL
jgi:hypothetical protein